MKYCNVIATSRGWHTLLALLLAGAVVAPACADALLDKAHSLVKADDSKAAYALLEPKEAERAGEIAFDLLFAQAAIEAGQNTRAVFALERVLAQQPNHALARAEIARAYLGIGEAANARREFENVKSQGVPAEIGRTIDSYLSAVDRLEASGKPSISGYIEAAIGYDSNVNIAPNRREVAIPGFGGLPFTLTDDSRATGDGFASLGAGLALRNPLSKAWALVANLSGSQRINNKSDQFDALNTEASIGAVLSQQKDIYSFNLQANSMAVESDRYRESAGFSAQWQHNLDGRSQVSAYAQYADVKLVTQPVRNHERWVLGAGYAQALRDGKMGYGSAYLLKEDPRDDVPWLDTSGFGLRLGGHMPLSGETSLFANAGIEWRQHRTEDPAFLDRRRDQQLNLGIGVSRQLGRDLKLSGQYGWMENRSNIQLNQYRRDLFTVTLRQDF